MKVLYTYKTGNTPHYVSNCNGTIRILILFQDGISEYVYYCDDYLSKTFINKIKNPLAKDKFNLENFERIQDDSQFNSYVSFIDNLYNYAGLHKEEKIDGNDLGSKLWLPE